MLFGTLAATHFAFAQTMNDVPLKTLDVEYVQIIGTGRSLSTKVNVEIDFGKGTKSIFF